MNIDTHNNYGSVRLMDGKQLTHLYHIVVIGDIHAHGHQTSRILTGLDLRGGIASCGLRRLTLPSGHALTVLPDRTHWPAGECYKYREWMKL